MEKYKNEEIHFDDRLRLNFDWGWGRYEFYNKDWNGETVFCSWVGIPPVGIHPCNFHPFPDKTSAEERRRHEEAVKAAGGCH
jgi:hypothetical protein